MPPTPPIHLLIETNMGILRTKQVQMKSKITCPTPAANYQQMVLSPPTKGNPTSKLTRPALIVTE